MRLDFERTFQLACNLECIFAFELLVFEFSICTVVEPTDTLQTLKIKIEILRLQVLLKSDGCD
ncbi:MAG: hypothetical protein QW717_08065 [Candidatus Bathyarchaeia archaeon]